MSEIILRKYHGVGNDYLIFDPKKNDVVLNERLIKQLCRRNIGVGADGILYGPLIEDKKIKVNQIVYSIIFIIFIIAIALITK